MNTVHFNKKLSELPIEIQEVINNLYLLGMIDYDDFSGNLYLTTKGLRLVLKTRLERLKSDVG